MQLRKTTKDQSSAPSELTWADIYLELTSGDFFIKHFCRCHAVNEQLRHRIPSLSDLKSISLRYNMHVLKSITKKKK